MSNSYQKFLSLKSTAGLHSPSVYELKKNLNMDIEIDACFLCNPYAFELFMTYFDKRDLKDYIKYYPPQNKFLSKLISETLNIEPNNLFVGNGAIQIIEILMNEFYGKKKCIITPTFSSYYEFDTENIVFFQTQKMNNFDIDVEELVSYCFSEKVEVLVIVNPNNPTGSVITKKNMLYLIESLPDVKIVVDESFIEFYNIDESLEQYVSQKKNLIIVRSLSKDFGIAGLRLGYCILDETMKTKIMKDYGLCWNVNGMAQIFLETLSDETFRNEYKVVKQQYNIDRDNFYNDLLKLENLKVYNSKANFFILDCYENVNQVFSSLLFDKKIYTRILNDKLHLDSSFLRIACGTREDNLKVYESLKQIENNL